MLMARSYCRRSERCFSSPCFSQAHCSQIVLSGLSAHPAIAVLSTKSLSLLASVVLASSNCRSKPTRAVSYSSAVKPPRTSVRSPSKARSRPCGWFILLSQRSSLALCFPRPGPPEQLAAAMQPALFQSAHFSIAVPPLASVVSASLRTKLEKRACSSSAVKSPSLTRSKPC